MEEIVEVYIDLTEPGYYSEIVTRQLNGWKITYEGVTLVIMQKIFKGE